MRSHKSANWTRSVILFVVLCISVFNAQSQTSYIIVHALNPEGVEIASIRGMDLHCVGIYDGDTYQIGFGAHDSATYNKPIPISPGDHTIKAVFNGMTKTENINLVNGETKHLVFTFGRIESNLTWNVDVSISASQSFSNDYDLNRMDNRSGDTVYEAFFWTYPQGNNENGQKPWMTGSVQGSASFHLDVGSCSGSTFVTASISGDYWGLDAASGIRPLGSGGYSGVYPISIPSQPDFVNWCSQYILNGIYPGARFSTTPTFSPDGYSSSFIQTNNYEPYWGETGYHSIQVPANKNYQGIIFISRLELGHQIEIGNFHEKGYSESNSGSSNISGGSLSNFKFSSVPYDLTRTGIKYEGTLPPIASFKYSPENPHVDEEITLDASSSYDTDGTIMGYDWTFGDGSTAEGKVLKHAYAKPGVDTVTLSVTDNDGMEGSTRVVLQIRPVPVILVHGWCSSSDTWGVLVPQLKEEKIEYYLFDYPSSLDPTQSASYLPAFISNLRNNMHYEGKFDIVCHSMGAIVSRWYMENLRGAQNIRQWIGIAPVSHGAAIADLDDDIQFKPLFALKDLSCFGVWVDQARIQMRTYSPTIVALDEDGIDPNTRYRVIVGMNSSNNIFFLFGLFLGSTYARKTDANGDYYYWTLQGDGVVAMEQSKLLGSNAVNEAFEGVNHINLPKDDAVVKRVIDLLRDPELPPLNPLPSFDPSDKHQVTGIGKSGILAKAQRDSIGFYLDSSVREATVLTLWPGSELGLTLVSPNGTTVVPGVDPNIKCQRSDKTIEYIINYPENGKWTALIDGIDVLEGGEEYSLMTFVESQLEVHLGTAENKNSYLSGDKATITGELFNGILPITQAFLLATIQRPDSGLDTVRLFDDGTHADSVAYDGIYTNEYVLGQKGIYGVSVYATKDVGERFERTDQMMLWVDLATNVNYESHKAPTRFGLYQNYPNPFNPSATIGYDLPHNSNVTLTVFTTLGQKVANIVNGRQEAGYHEVRFDGTNLPSGVYFYCLRAGDFVETKKLLIIR